MLDPWIIEEILRHEREDQERRREEGRRVEIPAESPRYRREHDTQPPPEESERGVVVIDI